MHRALMLSPVVDACAFLRALQVRHATSFIVGYNMASVEAAQEYLEKDPPTLKVEL